MEIRVIHQKIIEGAIGLLENKRDSLKNIASIAEDESTKRILLSKAARRTAAINVLREDHAGC